MTSSGSVRSKRSSGGRAWKAARRLRPRSASARRAGVPSLTSCGRRTSGARQRDGSAEIWGGTFGKPARNQERRAPDQVAIDSDACHRLGHTQIGTTPQPPTAAGLPPRDATSTSSRTETQHTSRGVPGFDPRRSGINPVWFLLKPRRALTTTWHVPPRHDRRLPTRRSGPDQWFRKGAPRR